MKNAIYLLRPTQLLISIFLLLLIVTSADLIMTVHAQTAQITTDASKCDLASLTDSQIKSVLVIKHIHDIENQINSLQSLSAKLSASVN